MPGLRRQKLEILGIRHVAEFQQHRGDIGSLENAKASGLERAFVQPGHRFELIHKRPREMDGERFGFPLCKIDKDVGDIAWLAGEVDAADGIGAVLVLGKTLGLLV